MSQSQRETYRHGLADLFSGYRAEWLNEQVFDLFTEPAYFPQLTTSHPCFLEGGRGTGKTTALRCLSYQGQTVLRRNKAGTLADWPYFGLYYRVNTNRVRAFSGRELETADWTRMFAHYVNLEFSELIANFLEWYTAQDPSASALTEIAFQPVAVALRLEGVTDLSTLITQLSLSKLKFEASINNIADEKRPFLSVQGGPIDALMREVKKLPQFASRPFFFLIDEYENLDDFQQRVVNTLVKHCGGLYSFKVGVRELGFRERSTLNSAEQLTSPADYKLINITRELEGRFVEFAREVCEQRLRKVFGTATETPKVQVLLPELSPEREAEQLGVKDAVAATIRILRENENAQLFEEWLSAAHPLEVFVLEARAKVAETSVSDRLQEAIAERERWREHYENFKHAYLFAIRPGKRGIRKYFAGWRVFCFLSGANIRYLLELVDQALSKHLDLGRGLSDPVDPGVQTKVAQDTGQRNLRELEGLSLNGAKLTRLLLGMGRVFQVMAEDPIGHTPEVTQFCLHADIADENRRRRLQELMTDGIMHLALLRYPGSKFQQQKAVRQVDYAIHPIFSAFFGFSYRRKRKIELSDDDILNLVDQPSTAIETILGRQNRTVDVELPEQMALFEGFYGGR